ncbi:GNAT family N-acetyltransferase [Caulobacter vibrioides]|uniref:Acetyltransferase, GNAT family n=2 Tax=Caulobacter vibrioides TaxID=155892 RepID=Q9A6I4_CAUVC|nr:GNAT family N-acetyltransferase [Caulobacter vibrioides]YP_002517568.1 acetyltransferase [Caulobacter vibrioides NA1000]AAK24081.1 acetyltransferase, GNAT family [Caulobacter vibrioides CB15]ACL95660.1 acetyltransferase [Caulobacter vibrioides NA1000]ATC28981.1 GNAT family N-acetyltransferase [Caulobacter vibrioides]QXZ50495.1 GNAT family N-acetyltransferase [Caulobacter vibrioides]
MLQLVRIFDELPDGFGDLVAEASGKGVRNMALLAEGWRAGVRFHNDGEALLAAFLAGDLAGIGAMTPEPAALEPARRLRRFYVRPDMRRRGVATALASALIHEGFDSVRLLTVNARAADAAAPFWEAQGFEPDTIGPWTHTLRR